MCIAINYNKSVQFAEHAAPFCWRKSQLAGVNYVNLFRTSIVLVINRSGRTLALKRPLGKWTRNVKYHCARSANNLRIKPVEDANWSIIARKPIKSLDGGRDTSLNAAHSKYSTQIL